MKKIVFLLILLSASLFAQNDEIFQQANDAYAQGNYEEAINKYNQILESGEASAALYYNLGNAHYKLNHIAESIYNYEKALLRDPGDEDIKNNIEFARNMAIDDIQEVDQTGFSQSVDKLISTFTANSWAVLGIVFCAFFAAFFLSYYFMQKPLLKRIFFGISIVMVLCGFLSIYFAYSQEEIRENNQYAIVFSEEAQVRNEPSLRGDEAFLLHEGTKARVLEDYQEWVKIELANGNQGWIGKDNIRRL
ncbi:tetratricopeptide repeat protein [Zunongwangia sp. F363]|uniref:Tetratricopeptide repeat protein n=1 Tax=Autumnicola tepida TaxID=3075595 RepID=A0ABU3C6N1_9FLAO|nr:tetratricopeptide repeat protein [Zunongwangia sp. F363]MDT0641994.1 tetratricopeptide repeat protein [Zunongwangia sp. F363]